MMRRRGAPLMRAARRPRWLPGQRALSTITNSRSMPAKRRPFSNSKTWPISRASLTRRPSNNDTRRRRSMRPLPRHSRAAPDLTAQLQQLAQLHTAGVLSDEEFAAAKQKLLAG